MSSITDNVSAQFLQDLTNDIYKVFAGVGNEWISENIVYATFGVPGSRGLANIESTNNPLGLPSATPRVGDFAATFDLDERVLTTVERMARFEIDPNDYIATFDNIRSKGLLNSMSLDPELRKAVMDIFGNSVASSLSKTMAIGDGSSTANASDNWLVGFFPLITTDVDTVRVNIAAGNNAIDTTNIFLIMEKMIQDLPARLDKKKRKTEFTISVATNKILQEANRLNGTTAVTYLQIGDFATFDGYPIKTVSDLPADYIQLTPQGNNKEGNLVMGAWAKADETSLKVYKESEGDTIFQAVLRFQAGVELRAAKDAFWYASTALVA